MVALGSGAVPRLVGAAGHHGCECGRGRKPVGPSTPLVLRVL